MSFFVWGTEAKRLSSLQRNAFADGSFLPVLRSLCFVAMAVSITMCLLIGSAMKSYDAVSVHLFGFFLLSGISAFSVLKMYIPAGVFPYRFFELGSILVGWVFYVSLGLPALFMIWNPSDFPKTQALRAQWEGQCGVNETGDIGAASIINSHRAELKLVGGKVATADPSKLRKVDCP
jgi:hypothetical protein